jgi:type II secretory pathway component PulK
MLILCLMLSALFLVMVLGMLGSRGPQQEAAAALRQYHQASALAQAGLQDFRVKLAKDLKFPPPPLPQSALLHLC